VAPWEASLWLEESGDGPSDRTIPAKCGRRDSNPHGLAAINS
jgi:hypothetical protein